MFHQGPLHFILDPFYVAIAGVTEDEIFHFIYKREYCFIRNTLSGAGEAFSYGNGYLLLVVRLCHSISLGYFHEMFMYKIIVLFRTVSLIPRVETAFDEW